MLAKKYLLMAYSFRKIKYCLLLLVLLIFSLQMVAQTSIQVSGTVVSEDQKPMAGVTISVKGANISTSSDQNGAWKLLVPGTPVTLVFSFVGYESKEEQVKGRKVVNIELTSEAKSMEEVVIIGYAAVKRKDLTGSVSSVNSQQLKDIRVSSVAEALAGRLAGVQIISSEGKPGSEFTIKVRGGSSITQDNSPLYVVDGIQVENGLNDLAPQDIESIDVLKDAASTAIYGARGANGVVIITTKKGREGRTTVNYNGFYGIRTVRKKLEVMSPYDFIWYQYERTRRLTQDSATFANLYGNDLNVYKTIKNIDWQEEMFGRNAPMQTHNISVGGGSKGTTFNLSFTYNKEDGVMLNSGLDRKLVNFKLDHKASEKFRVGFNVRYNNQEVTGAGTADEGSSGYNMLRHSVKYRPFIIGNVNDPAQYDPDYFDASNAGNGLGIINPIQLSNAQYRKIFTKVFNMSGFLNYSFNKFLSFRSTVGVDHNITDRHNFDDTLTSNSRTNGASLPLIALYNGLRTTIDNSNVFTYTNAYLRKKSLFDIIVGNEIYNVVIKNTDNQLRYFPLGITAEKSIGQQNLGTAVPLFPRNNNAESRQISFFGRANYAYMDKYLLSLSLRADGSSKFAIDNHWGYFPSASVAWRISHEPFMANMNGISDLKLRASYGEAGNNRIGDYLYSTSYATTSQYALNDIVQNGYASTYLANKNLKWETNVS
jgi:TonB-linked SusC/RagA family outer membrane protein